MTLDPFADELPRRKPDRHEVGQDLSKLSIEEIDERVELLEREIRRLKEARARKEDTRAAASAFFKLGS
jgi:uncharacterized small protein (DUF1192 family)